MVEDPPPAGDHMAREAHCPMVGEVSADQGADGAGKGRTRPRTCRRSCRAHAADRGPPMIAKAVVEEARPPPSPLDGRGKNDQLHHAARPMIGRGPNSPGEAREATSPPGRSECRPAGWACVRRGRRAFPPDRHHHGGRQQIGRWSPRRRAPGRFSSEIIRGMAVATIVWSSADSRKTMATPPQRHPPSQESVNSGRAHCGPPQTSRTLSITQAVGPGGERRRIAARADYGFRRPAAGGAPGPIVLEEAAAAAGARRRWRARWDRRCRGPPPRRWRARGPPWPW